MVLDHPGFVCPVCRRPMVTANDRCSGATFDSTHPSSVEPIVEGADCPECDGNGEVEQCIRQDYFGVWDTQTFRCTACDGTGHANHDQEHHDH